MAKVAAAAGAPFIAGASPGLLGCDSVADLPDRRKWTKQPAPEIAAAWTALRGLPEARYLGLTLPRFLIRLPYGKETESTELFDFEEIPDAAAHDDYLWANAGLCSQLCCWHRLSRSRGGNSVRELSRRSRACPFTFTPRKVSREPSRVRKF